MARPKKKRKMKEPKSHIYRVPLLALKVYDSEQEAAETVDHCDQCDRQPTDEEWDDPSWMLTLGVTEKGQLAVARLCPDCFPALEWGDVYCPKGLGTLAVPVGIAPSPPTMVHGRADERKTA